MEDLGKAVRYYLYELKNSISYKAEDVEGRLTGEIVTYDLPVAAGK